MYVTLAAYAEQKIRLSLMPKTKKIRKGKKLLKPLSLYGHSMEEILVMALSSPPKKKLKELDDETNETEDITLPADNEE